MVTSEKLKKELETLKFRDHLACIYKNKEEQLSTVIPFILTGLHNNEKCVYIVDENTKQEIIEAFTHIIDIEKYIESNQLELLTKEEAYLKDNYFDPDKMIELLSRSEEKALKDGYSGLRVTGEMTWIFTKLPGVERLIEYEAKLNYFFPKSTSIALCQYNEKKFNPEILLDVIRTHPKLIIYDTLYQNPHYLPPDEFFARLKGEIRWNTYEKVRNNVIERKKIEEKAKKRKIERNLVLNSMSELVIYYGEDKRIKWVNKAAAALDTDHSIEGKFCYEVWHCKGNPCEACPVYKVWESGLYEHGEITTVDGRVWHLKATPVYENGGMMGVVEVARDITQPKQAEMQLKNLFEASRLINSTMDMEELFEFISDAVQALVGFDHFVIFLGEEEGRRVYPAYASERMRDLVEGLSFYYGEGLIGNCMKTKEPVFMSSVEERKEKGLRDKKEVHIPEMTSQLAVPLIMEDECVGALHVSQSTPNAYDQDDLAVLQTLGEIVSSAIRNSKLHNEIKAFSQELEKRVEEKSRRTEIILGTKQILQTERNWEKGLTTIVGSIGKLGFERRGVFLVNQRRKTLDFHCGEGVNLPEEGTSVSLKETDYFGVQCVREKKTVYVKDASTAEGKQIAPAHSFVWVPIVVQNEAFAAIAAWNITSDKFITEEDIKDLEILAGMCAIFIDRTRMQIEPVAENELHTEVEHWLAPSECYIIIEKKPEKSFDIFVDLVTHGVAGFVISREYPEKVKRKYNLVKTPVLWLTRTERENAVNPDDLSKLIYMIGNFTRKNGNSVILLDGLEYLVTQTGFQAVLGHLQELKDVIAMNESRLIIPLHKDTLPSKEYSILEREFTILEFE